MDTFFGMRLFAQTVQSGSFSEAGRTLGMAPSSVSRQISMLEDRLGVRLLNRSTRQLHLTEAGQIYYDRTTNILHAVEDANLAVAELESKPRGLLRLNIPVTFGRRHIIPALSGFMDLYPEVEMDVTMTDAMINVIEDGADLVVRIGELKDSSLIAKKLAANNRALCCSPEYLKKHGAPATPKDLKDHRCLTYRRAVNPDMWHFADSSGNVEHVKINAAFHVNNGEALQPLARDGQGLILLPTDVVGSDLRRGSLVSVLEDYQASPISMDTGIYALYPSNRHMSPKVRAFVDYIKGHFGAPPYWDNLSPDPSLTTEE